MLQRKADLFETSHIFTFQLFSFRAILYADYIFRGRTWVTKATRTEHTLFLSEAKGNNPRNIGTHNVVTARPEKRPSGSVVSALWRKDLLPSNAKESTITPMVNAGNAVVVFNGRTHRLGVKIPLDAGFLTWSRHSGLCIISRLKPNGDVRSVHPGMLTNSSESNVVTSIEVEAENKIFVGRKSHISTKLRPNPCVAETWRLLTSPLKMTGLRRVPLVLFQVVGCGLSICFRIDKAKQLSDTGNKKCIHWTFVSNGRLSQQGQLKMYGLSCRCNIDL